MLLHRLFSASRLVESLRNATKGCTLSVDLMARALRHQRSFVTVEDGVVLVPRLEPENVSIDEMVQSLGHGSSSLSSADVSPPTCLASFHLLCSFGVVFVLELVWPRRVSSMLPSITDAAYIPLRPGQIMRYDHDAHAKIQTTLGSLWHPRV